MTPRKDETPEEFRARLRARYAAADPEYREKGGWHGSGNGGDDATRLILCTANSY
jgi:hypothetical protein